MVRKIGASARIYVNNVNRIIITKSWLYLIFFACLNVIHLTPRKMIGARKHPKKLN